MKELWIEKPRRILIFYPRRIGDWVVTTPFLRGLRQKFPEAEIVAVCSAKSAAVMPLIPFMNSFHVLGRPEDIGQNLRLLKFLLTSGTWDLYIDLDPNPAFSRGGWIFSHLISARYKGGFLRKKNESFQIRVPTPDKDEPMLSRYQRMADFLGLPYEMRTELKINSEDLDFVRSEIADLENQFSKGKKVLIHPGDLKRESGARWPREKFVELGKRLKEDGSILFLLAGPGEKNFIESLARDMGLDLSCMVGPRPLGEAAAFMLQMDLFISSVDGASHVAGALGVCTFSIYTGSAWRVWRIPGERDLGLAGDWHDCRGVEVEQAYQAVKSILRR